MSLYKNESRLFLGHFVRIRQKFNKIRLWLLRYSFLMPIIRGECSGRPSHWPKLKGLLINLRDGVKGRG